MRVSACQPDVEARFRGILDTAEGDIRRAALQYQACGKSDAMVPRREELFNSVPEVVVESGWRSEMYSALCDCLLVADCDDAFFDAYVRPAGETVFAPLRKGEMAERYEFLKEAMPG
jgi:hypothetical protein